MQPVRLGVIGAGVIGRMHLRVAAESALLTPVAVADVRAAVAREVAAQHGVARAYGSAAALLADPEIEAVVLALPAAGRAELALAAFSAGKHVLVEKPIALDADQVRRMIAARGDLIAGCCSSRMRGLPSASVATALIASGVLGQLRVVRCRAIKGAGTPPQNPPPPWRLSRAMNGGGILVNWGCYDLDYLLGITGWAIEPRLALARTWGLPKTFAAYAAPGSSAETHVAALILCNNGLTLSYERGEFVAGATDEAWQVLGDRGALRLQMPPGVNKSIWHDEATAQGVVSNLIWQGDEPGGSEHVLVLEDFARAIRENRAPRTSLEQALLVQRITDAIYASAECAAAVEIA